MMVIRVLALVLVSACWISDPGYRMPEGGTPGDGTVVDAPPVEFSSCLHLDANCGKDAIGNDANDNCCNSPPLPGGTYLRGSDSAAQTPFKDSNSLATVSAFRLDKYEVTVGRFRAFVDAEMGTQEHPPQANAGAHAKIRDSGWNPDWNTNLAVDRAALLKAINECAPVPAPSDERYPLIPTWNDSPGDRDAENRPMNCITWYEAMAFCAWDGGYLPTEAEWIYAATGGSDQRAFPWSDPPRDTTLDPSRASYGKGPQPDGTDECYGDGVPACAVTDLLDVGSLPAGDGRWLQSDLTGNVGEWMLDYRDDPDDKNEDMQYFMPCTDCAQLTPVSSSNPRALRGGSFSDHPEYLRVAKRGYVLPADRESDVGVRCARPAVAAAASK